MKVEAIGEAAQVLLGVLAVDLRVERAGQRGLDVAQYGILISPQAQSRLSGYSMEFSYL